MVMNGSTNQLLQVVDQHRKAYQLVLGLHGYQLQTNNEDRSCLTPECTQNGSTKVNTKWENPPLEHVMEKRNREHAEKTEEFISMFSDLERKKSDLRTGKRKSPYKSRFPSLTQPTSPPSERSSVLAEHGSRIASSLSENSALLKPPRLFSQNDATISNIVASIRNNMPATLARVNRLRQEFERDELRRRRTRLYRGEWGPQSYERWQMNDYFVVRPIVEELVERVLSIIFKSRSLPALDAYPHSRAFAQIQSNSKLLQLIVEELILEETRSLSLDISSETYQMQRFLADRIGSGFLQIIQKASCGDCELTCAACDRHAKSLPEKFHDQQNDRMKNRRGIWHQSQCVQLDPWKKERDDSVSSINGEAVLSFDHLISYDLIKTRSFAGVRSGAESAWRQNSDAFRQMEAKYWSLMTPSGFTLPITDNCSGISVVKASFNRRYVAVGTVRGNIFVIDFNWTPPKPIRVGVGVKDDAVVDIAWSIDSSKLISNTDKGVVCVWSLLFEKNSKNTTASVEEGEDGAMPDKFFPIFKLEAAVQDFKFYTGPLAERSLHNNPTKPLLAAFHSSMTLCGSQPSLCLVLDSNDVIKCDISEQLNCSEETENGDDAELNNHQSSVVYHPQVFPLSGRMNVIGSDVKAEIFRQHRHSIMLLGFVGNCRDMVTMDTGGYINRWKYAREFLATEEIFVPFKRYRLSLHQTQYIPLGERKMIFSDEDDDHRPRPEAEIQQERDRVETVISSAMNQLHLWHFQSSSDQRSPMDSFIYKPSEGVDASGATFHAVIRHSGNGLLSSYFTQQFSPVQNEAGRIVVCRLSPSGKEMVIGLIFPELKPKEAHLAILVLDVCEMRFKNFRRDIVLPDDTLYGRCLKENLVSCDITDPLGITASQYIIVIVNGNLSGYSVTTGQMVLTSAAKTSPDFVGCHLNTKKFFISEDSRLAVTSARGTLFLALYEPRRKDSKSPLFILRLKDKNSDLTRKQLRKSIMQRRGDAAVLPPSEQRIDLVRWTTGPLHSQHHINVMVRELLESVVDGVFDKIHGVTVLAENTAENAKRRSKLYAELGREVSTFWHHVYSTGFGFCSFHILLC